MSTSATVEISVLTQRLRDLHCGFTAAYSKIESGECIGSEFMFFHFIRNKFNIRNISYEEVQDLPIPALAKHLHSKGILPGDRP